MKKSPWQGLIELDSYNLRTTFRLMLAHLEGEVVDFRYLGDRLAIELNKIDSTARWLTVKHQVMLGRRRLARVRYKEQQAQQQLDRRAYMRMYMRKYRKRGTKHTPAG